MIFHFKWTFPHHQDFACYFSVHFVYDCFPGSIIDLSHEQIELFTWSLLCWMFCVGVIVVQFTNDNALLFMLSLLFYILWLMIYLGQCISKQWIVWNYGTVAVHQTMRIGQLLSVECSKRNGIRSDDNGSVNWIPCVLCKTLLLIEQGPLSAPHMLFSFFVYLYMYCLNLSFNVLRNA